MPLCHYTPILLYNYINILQYHNTTILTIITILTIVTILTIPTTILTIPTAYYTHDTTILAIRLFRLFNQVFPRAGPTDTTMTLGRATEEDPPKHVLVHVSSHRGFFGEECMAPRGGKRGGGKGVGPVLQPPTGPSQARAGVQHMLGPAC